MCLLFSILCQAALATDKVTLDVHTYDYDFRGIANNDSVWVAVGGRSQIWYSKAALANHWERATSPVKNTLGDVSWCGDAFYAVSDSGDIIRSSDGIDWTKSATGLGVMINQIERTGSGLIAIANGGHVLRYDSTAARWKDSILTRRNLVSMAVNDSVVVVAGDSGAVLHSRNGIDWTRDSIDTTKSVIRVIWSKREKTFAYLMDDGNIFSQRDSSWIKATADDDGYYFNGFTETPTGYLAVSDGSWFTLSDSLKGARTTGQSASYIEISANRSTIIAAGYSGTLARWNPGISDFSGMKQFMTGGGIVGGAQLEKELGFLASGSNLSDETALLVIGEDSTWRKVPIYSSPDTSEIDLSKSSLTICAMDSGIVIAGANDQGIYSGRYRNGEKQIMLQLVSTQNYQPVLLATDTGFVLLAGSSAYTSRNGVDWKYASPLVIKDSTSIDSVVAHTTVWTGRYIYSFLFSQNYDHLDLWRTENFQSWEKIPAPNEFDETSLYSIKSQSFYNFFDGVNGEQLYSITDNQTSWTSGWHAYFGSFFSGTSSIIFTQVNPNPSVSGAYIWASLDTGKTFIQTISSSGDSVKSNPNWPPSQAIVQSKSNQDGSIWLHSYYHGDGTDLVYGNYHITRNQTTSLGGGHPKGNLRVQISGKRISFSEPVEGAIDLDVFNLQGRKLGSVHRTAHGPMTQMEFDDPMESGSGTWVIRACINGVAVNSIQPGIGR
jgi:hypothetical protein